MRIRLILLVLITILAAPGASCQKSAFWTGFGLQASRMDDLKYYQELILENYRVEGKVISSFPSYITGSFGYLRQLYPTIRIGGGYSYSATGAKLNYSDYTGYLTTEMTATSHRLGGFASYSVFGGKRIELSINGRLEIKYTSLDLMSSIYALGYSDYGSSTYTSVSPGGSAGIELLIHLGKYSFGAEAGYEVDVPGKLSNKETKNDLLDPFDQDRVLTSDWTGWYAQIKFLFWLDN
jgi:hypothetical protein